MKQEILNRDQYYYDRFAPTLVSSAMFCYIIDSKRNKTVGQQRIHRQSSSVTNRPTSPGATYARSLSAAQTLLLTEVVTLLKLILVMPASNAASKHSFSALRQAKTFLRTTMNQFGLNHLMVLHIHKQITDDLNSKDVADYFVSDSEL